MTAAHTNMLGYGYQYSSTMIMMIPVELSFPFAITVSISLITGLNSIHNICHVWMGQDHQ